MTDPEDGWITAASVQIYNMIQTVLAFSGAWFLFVVMPVVWAIAPYADSVARDGMLQAVLVCAGMLAIGMLMVAIDTKCKITPEAQNR